MFRYMISQEFLLNLFEKSTRLTLSNDSIMAKAKWTYPRDGPTKLSTARRLKNCTRHRKGLEKCFSWGPRRVYRHQEFVSALIWMCFLWALRLRRAKLTRRERGPLEKTAGSGPSSPMNPAKRRQSHTVLAPPTPMFDKCFCLSIFPWLSRTLSHSLNFFHWGLRLYIASLLYNRNSRLINPYWPDRVLLSIDELACERAQSSSSTAQSVGDAIEELRNTSSFKVFLLMTFSKRERASHHPLSMKLFVCMKVRWFFSWWNLSATLIIHKQSRGWAHLAFCWFSHMRDTPIEESQKVFSMADRDVQFVDQLNFCSLKLQHELLQLRLAVELSTTRQIRNRFISSFKLKWFSLFAQNICQPHLRLSTLTTLYALQINLATDSNWVMITFQLKLSFLRWGGTKSG